LNKNVHFVKTTNKLIGEIEDKGLYGSDEELLNDGFGAGGREEMHLDQDLRGQDLQLDFGAKPTVEADKATGGAFLQKMKTKRQLQEEEGGIEQSVINLGFVKNLAAQTMSANQLAASGI